MSNTNLNSESIMSTVDEIWDAAGNEYRQQLKKTGSAVLAYRAAAELAERLENKGDERRRALRNRALNLTGEGKS